MDPREGPGLQTLLHFECQRIKFLGNAFQSNLPSPQNIITRPKTIHKKKTKIFFVIGIISYFYVTQITEKKQRHENGKQETKDYGHFVQRNAKDAASEQAVAKAVEEVPVRHDQSVEIARLIEAAVARLALRMGSKTSLFIVILTW